MMTIRMIVFAGVLLLLCSNLLSTGVMAQAPDALASDQLPDDRRLEPLKDLNGYFPFAPPASLDEWERRREEVRTQLLVSLGLWPMPQQTQLNAVIHGKVEKDDYTVERVYFESMPGFYVTGSLYRPTGEETKRPAILCPHGHWANGRFHDAGEGTAESQIEQGAEQFTEAARSPLQARCVHLARMGCVVFHYDMIGYADSRQISYELAHRFATQRADMNREEGFGLFSPQAESQLQSVMGLQAFNSIRALDFLESLPDVDPDRLAVTGASGGGTQTFILAAIDPRPAVCFPAVMVSTAMQGGCTCENCSLLRVGTGNVEIAGLFAPKPMALSAADDWTVEMETKGFPQLKSLYGLYQKEDDVALISRTEFGHNYNHVCRAFMYEWFNEHLGLEADTTEREFERLTQQEMTVWNDDHPLPPVGDDFERELMANWHADSQQQLEALIPKSEQQLDDFRNAYGAGIDAIIGRSLPDANELDWEQTQKIDRGSYLMISGLLTQTSHSEQLPMTFLYPKEWNGTAVVWLTQVGKSGIFNDADEPQDDVQSLLDQGSCVASVDLLYQGEFLADGASIDQTRRVENPREAAGYTFGYNRSLLARRVHDVLNVIQFVRTHEYTPNSVVLASFDSTAPIAVAAAAQAGTALDGLAVDTQGFRFAHVTDLHDPSFLPGGAKYGDVPGMLAMAAPVRVWLRDGQPSAPAIVQSVYTAESAEDLIHVDSGEPEQATQRFLDWLNLID